MNKLALCFALTYVSAKQTIYELTKNPNPTLTRCLLLPDKIPVMETENVVVTKINGDDDYLQDTATLTTSFMSAEITPNNCIFQGFEPETNEWVEIQYPYGDNSLQIFGPETQLICDLKNLKIDFYKKCISGFNVNDTKVNLTISDKGDTSFSVYFDDKIELPFALNVSPILKSWNETVLEYEWDMTVAKGLYVKDLIGSFDTFGYGDDGAHMVNDGSLVPNKTVLLPNGSNFSFNFFYYQCDNQYTNFTELTISNPVGHDSDNGFIISSQLYFDNQLLIEQEYADSETPTVLVDNTPPLTDPLFDVNDEGKTFKVRYTFKDAVPGKI